MQSFVKCSDTKLAAWLLSKPHKAERGTMLLVCNGRAVEWPIVPPGAAACCVEKEPA